MDSTSIVAELHLNEWLAAWLQRVETRDESTERVTEIFDTAQPPDSATGTPPLMSRIRERHEARSRSDSRAKTALAKCDSASADIRTTVTADDNTTTKSNATASGNSMTQSREKRGTPVGTAIAGILAGLIMACFFLWLSATVVKAIIHRQKNN